MTLARYTGTVQDAAGNAVAGCEIEVRKEDTGLLAVLYSDRDGLNQISNRFTAPDATFSFHTTGGAYRVVATKGAFSAEWRYVAIGTMQEQDVEGIVFALQAGIVPALTRAELELYILPVPEEGEALPRAGVVYADPTPSNNGYWVYSFDDTEWQFARPLSDTLARLTIVGGDENAIVATASPGVDPASVVAFFIEPDDPNTGPVTISINGDDPVSAYDYTGAEFPAGAFSGRLFLTLEADGSLRSVMPADLVAQAQYWAELSEQVALPDGSIAEAKLDTALATKINDKLNGDGSNATAQTKWRLKPIGEVIYVDTSLTGVEIPPEDAGFIELSAGLDGVGEYNEGKLISETITGSGATLVATAVIDDTDSPMDGQTINLINTEERVRYAGERAKSGDVFNDQMQQITGDFTATRFTADAGTKNGAFSGSTGTTGGITASGNGGGTNTLLDFDNANSPDARTGDRTRAKGHFLVAFLKYKDVA